MDFQEGEVIYEDGYFFRYLGGIQFLPVIPPSVEEKLPGNSRILVASNKYGLTIHADQSRIYVGQTSKLIGAASKEVGSAKYQVPSPESLCLAALETSTPVLALALSADELVLACVHQTFVAFYQLPSLAAAKSGAMPRPDYTVPLEESGVKQFAWRQVGEDTAAADPRVKYQFLVLSEERELSIGVCGLGSWPVSCEVECFSWSPAGSGGGGADFSFISGGKQLCVKTAVDSMETESISFVSLSHLDVGSMGAEPNSFVSMSHPDAIKMLTEDQLSGFVIYTGAGSHTHLLMAASELTTDDGEQSDRFLCKLTCGKPGPNRCICLRQITKGSTDMFQGPNMHWEDSTDLLQGPYMHCAGVPEWDVFAAAHRKAADDHIQLYEVAPEPQQIMVTDDGTRIALPNGAGGSDNFVLGLAIDRTCNTEADTWAPPSILMVAHPILLPFYASGILRTAPSPFAQCLTCQVPSLSGWLGFNSLLATRVSCVGRKKSRSRSIEHHSSTEQVAKFSAPATFSDQEAAAAAAPLPSESESEWDDASSTESTAAPVKAAPPASISPSVPAASTATATTIPTTTPAFNFTSAPAFGSSSTGIFSSTPTASTTTIPTTTPAFNFSSAPAFGSSSAGVSSSKPAASTTTTPAFDFSSATAFGTSSAGLSSSKPAASTTTTPAFNFSSAPAFAPAVGSVVPAVGSVVPFGSSAPAFGSSAPAFGSSAPAFGFGGTTSGAAGQGSTATAFGTPSTPTGSSTAVQGFGMTAFGTATAFGTPSTPTGSTTAGQGFGTPAFGTATAFGTPSTPPGSTTAGQGFGTPAFGTATAFGTPSTPTGSTTAGQGFGTTAFGTAAFGASSPLTPGANGTQGAAGFGFAGCVGAGATAGLFAPPASALAPPVATDDFIPSLSFTGSKPGFVFTTRPPPLGTGYHRDTPPTPDPSLFENLPVYKPKSSNSTPCPGTTSATGWGDPGAAQAQLAGDTPEEPRSPQSPRPRSPRRAQARSPQAPMPRIPQAQAQSPEPTAQSRDPKQP
eukprot:gene10685-12376_t